ncbi:TetR/AcrR family transcriptional regulator [Culicoidibacter larvae]|uniref:Helix-turn-helix transcriptional regulator n=1 Tax=Culicoidibacter larvae TaxID=2579976 RepID=A0A5R8QBC9_9FIRM|nr:TetR family transcriptional regulator [Culicoidibacter larvae]TLG73848.1 helix-turn-helix transcriptional regulator [Culicoidibacter larvae]
MPKVVSEVERTQVRDAIYEVTMELIRQKGLRRVTVDDIVAGVRMSKGSFYTYYASKELCFFEVIKRDEAALFDKMKAVRERELDLEEQLRVCIREVYLAEDSLVLFVSTEDLLWLFRKLPVEKLEEKKLLEEEYFSQTFEMFGLDKENYDLLVWSNMISCLHFMAHKVMEVNNKMIPLEQLIAERRAAEISMGILIDGIVGYLIHGAKEA